MARRLGHPVWLGHWPSPELADWSARRALPVDAEVAARKQRAIAAHRSQVAPLSDRPGDETLLGEHLLAHFALHRGQMSYLARLVKPTS